MKINTGLKLGMNYFIRSFQKPSVMALESSADCQADCIMCGREKLKRDKQAMTMDTYKKAISEAKKNKIKVIQLSFYGEPLLDPQLIAKLEYLRQQIPDALIVFNTNGEALTDELIEAVLKYKVTAIRFSLEGNNKVEYESIRNGLSYNKLINNMAKLKTARDKQGSDLAIIVWALNLKSYPMEKEAFRKFWLQYADDIHIRNEAEIILSKKEKLFQKVAPCFRPFAYFIVLADGRVTICDIDWYGEHVYGSLKENSLKELWFSKKMLFLRFVHLFGFKRTLSSCEKCRYKPFSSHFQNSYYQK